METKTMWVVVSTVMNGVASIVDAISKIMRGESSDSKHSKPKDSVDQK